MFNSPRNRQSLLKNVQMDITTFARFEGLLILSAVLYLINNIFLVS